MKKAKLCGGGQALSELKDHFFFLGFSLIESYLVVDN